LTASTPEDKLKKEVNGLLKEYIENLEAVKIRQGLRIFMEISARGNAYLQENKLDNALFANHRDRCDTVINTAVNLVYLLSALIYPYIPTTTDNIIKQLKCSNRRITEVWDGVDILPGHVIGNATYLFKPIDETRVDELRAKYSGNSNSQQTAVPVPAKKGNSKKKPVEIVPTTPEQIALAQRIQAQGEIVRKLKADKADAGEVKAQLEQLIVLKKNLADIS
jgi:methionyl-tRNA synthetase